MKTSHVAIKGLHHFERRCKDAEEPRHFYEDLLGLPLVQLILTDYVPSTGQYCPYVHIFFRMGDGSCIAFFALGDDAAAGHLPVTPPGSITLHWKLTPLRTCSGRKSDWKPKV